VVGLAITGAFAYSTGVYGNDTTQQSEICKATLMALHDESPNPSLSADQLQRLSALELQIFSKCDIEAQ
jgi:hypothetical protein